MKIFTWLLFLTFSFNILAQDREIEFRDLTFSEALTAADEENKPIFMDCYTTWCGPCKWMAANIFTKNEIADFYNENFVCVKFDMEKGEGIELAKEFKIRAYPTLLFVNANRELVMKQIGAPRDPEPYINLGENAKSEDYNLIALSKNVDDNLSDASYMAKYFEVMASADMVDPEMTDLYFSQTPKDEWLKKENVEILTFIDHDIEGEMFQDILARSEEYIAVDSKMEQVIGYSVGNALLNTAYSREENAEKDYLSLLAKVKSWDFPKKGETLFTVESRVLRGKSPELYIDYCVENVNPNLWENANELNSVAWYFFKNTENPSHLDAAEIWAARAVSLDPSHHILDTYANLLFVNGKHAKALEIETQALEKARTEGVNTRTYEDLIAEIRESM